MKNSSVDGLASSAITLSMAALVNAELSHCMMLAGDRPQGYKKADM